MEADIESLPDFSPPYLCRQDLSVEPRADKAGLLASSLWAAPLYLSGITYLWAGLFTLSTLDLKCIMCVCVYIYVYSS